MTGALALLLALGVTMREPPNMGEIARFHQRGMVYRLKFVPRSDYFVSGAWNGGVRLRSLKDPDVEVILADKGVAVDVSEDGKWIVVGTFDGLVLLYEMPHRNLKKEWRAPHGSILTLQRI